MAASILEAIDTRHVAGRRTLRYADFEQVLADAEQLAGGENRELGNWSLGQVLKHLAVGMDMSIDGNPFDAHLLTRVVARLFVRRRLIYKGMSPGIKLPGAMAEQLVPGPTSVEEGLDALRTAVARQERDPTRAKHPILGPMSVEEWRQFHLRHAELHLSFIVPV